MTRTSNSERIGTLTGADLQKSMFWSRTCHMLATLRIYAGHRHIPFFLHYSLGPGEERIEEEGVDRPRCFVLALWPPPN